MACDVSPVAMFLHSTPFLEVFARASALCTFSHVKICSSTACCQAQVPNFKIAHFFCWCMRERQQFLFQFQVPVENWLKIGCPKPSWFLEAPNEWHLLIILIWRWCFMCSFLVVNWLHFFITKSACSSSSQFKNISQFQSLVINLPSCCQIF